MGQAWPPSGFRLNIMVGCSSSMVRHVAADARQHGCDPYYHANYSNLYYLYYEVHIYDFDVKKTELNKITRGFFSSFYINSYRCLQIVGSRIRFKVLKIPYSEPQKALDQQAKYRLYPGYAWYLLQWSWSWGAAVCSTAKSRGRGRELLAVFFFIVLFLIFYFSVCREWVPSFVN